MISWGSISSTRLVHTKISLNYKNHKLQKAQLQNGSIKEDDWQIKMCVLQTKITPSRPFPFHTKFQTMREEEGGRRRRGYQITIEDDHGDKAWIQVIECARVTYLGHGHRLKNYQKKDGNFYCNIIAMARVKRNCIWLCTPYLVIHEPCTELYFPHSDMCKIQNVFIKNLCTLILKLEKICTTKCLTKFPKHKIPNYLINKTQYNFDFLYI